MANKKSPHLAFSIKYRGIARELISEVEIINPLNNQRKKYKAIWDTGATHTAITSKVSKELSLIIVDTTTIIGVKIVKLKIYKSHYLIYYCQIAYL